MSGCECKPGRAQPSRKRCSRSKGPKSPGLRPGLHTVAAPAASIGCASRVILDSSDIATLSFPRQALNVRRSFKVGKDLRGGSFRWAVTIHLSRRFALLKSERCDD